MFGVIYISLLALTFAQALVPQRRLPGPTVVLDYGSFVGVTNATSKITSFRGVRYADAPVGNLRWRAPVSPPTTNLGVVDATKFADICIQTTQASVTSGSSEDCLFGNINIPVGTTSDDSLPVMVYFHGGGFQGGSTHDAPPELLIDGSTEPIIFVTFEYRLGQFGFLGGPQVHSDGVLNAGLLDQRAALRWVQRYIKNFGGDKTRVTIWGQSAGAGSTMFHLLGNGGNNEGLFQAAMGDSPSLNFLPKFTEAYVENIFTQFASFAGCAGKGLSCLRAASSDALTKAGSQTIGARTTTLFVFAPIIDGSFLPERPVEAFANGHFSRVPTFFGSNTNEGAHWSSTLPNGGANTSMPNATEATVFNFIQGQYPHFTQKSFNTATSRFYPLSDFNGSFSLQGQQMYGEMRYICTATMVTGSAATRKMPSFGYHYDNPHLGSNHAAELTAFFTLNPTTANAADLGLFVAMRQFWTSFVTGESPTARSTRSWNPVTSIDGSPRMLLNPAGPAAEKVSTGLADRCNFWHGLKAELHT